MKSGNDASWSTASYYGLVGLCLNEQEQGAGFEGLIGDANDWEQQMKRCFQSYSRMFVNVIRQYRLGITCVCVRFMT